MSRYLGVSIGFALLGSSFVVYGWYNAFLLSIITAILFGLVHNQAI